MLCYKWQIRTCSLSKQWWNIKGCRCFYLPSFRSCCERGNLGNIPVFWIRQSELVWQIWNIFNASFLNLKNRNWSFVFICKLLFLSKTKTMQKKSWFYIFTTTVADLITIYFYPPFFLFLMILTFEILTRNSS